MSSGPIKTISSQAALLPVIDQLIPLLQSENDSQKALSFFEHEALRHKVKFPVLEHLAKQLHKSLSNQRIESLMQEISETRHISVYPIIGKLIQLQLQGSISDSFKKAIDHIIKGDEWYACDIISERVFGEGLLQYFSESYPLIKGMANHENQWIQRSIGIGTHYATKKGLRKEDVDKLFLLMLENGYKTQLYIKKGIGWPAKTIAKWHPDIIYQHQELIFKTKTSKWFKNKINIGLSMAKKPLLNYE